MKNKIKLIVVLSMLTIVATLFSGCFLKDFNRVKTISLVGTPKIVYYQNEDFDAAGLKIRIEYENEKQEQKVEDVKSDLFTIDFSSAEIGTHKCVITLVANKNVTISFDYSVIAPDGTFTEGDGSQASPYVVYTAKQFANIGAEAGKYYVLGDNIDLTKAQTINSYYYNINKRSFVLDGQGYAISMGNATYRYAFECPTDATIKNLVLNIVPGFAHETVLSLHCDGDVVFENITTNGIMEAEQNTAMLTCVTRFTAKTITIKNCVNNVNLTGTAPYCAAFVGLLGAQDGTGRYDLQNITFENCVNNGNIEGVTSWVFIGNGAKNTGNISVNNCRNNGKLVAGAVGMFNATASNAVPDALVTKESYNNYNNNTKALYEKISECSFVYMSDDFVVVPNLVSKGSDSNYRDITLVKTSDNKVVFSEAAKDKIPAGYKVNVYVRDWVDYQSGTNYMYTKGITNIDFELPYVAVEIDETKTAEYPQNSIYIGEDGKLKLASTVGGDSVKLKGTKYQYYCYSIYDASGALKYCGQINYNDIQNA